MPERRCPVWVGYLLLSPLRKWLQNPTTICKPYIRPGMTVLDFGSAMGYFSLPLARLVRPDGRIVCADIEEKMLTVLHKRAVRAGLDHLIEFCPVREDLQALSSFNNRIDFALLFAVAHEVPDQMALFVQLSNVLKKDGRLLFSEPSGHVSRGDFDASVKRAEKAGLICSEELHIRRSYSVIFKKG